LESTGIPISGDVTVPNIVTTDIGDNWTYNGTTGLWTFSSTTSLPSLNDTIKFSSSGGGTTAYNINTTYYVIDLDSTNRTLKLSLEKGSYPVVDTTNSTGNWKANKVDLYLTGNNTKFTDELKIGDFLRLGAVDIEIKNIVSDTLLEVMNSFDTVGLYNSPEMKFNLNNEFEIGDCITLIKASDGNVVNVTDSSGLTIKVYVISISSDHQVILNNGIDANDYLICRQPKTFSIFKKDSASSILSIDANNNTIGINTESASGLLEINQSGSSEKVALKINANEDDIDTVNITADSLTTGSALNISSDSNSTATRNLVKIVNDNTLATNTTLLYLKNDAIPTQAAVTFESTTVNTDNPILELKNSNTTTLNYSVLDFNRSDTTTVANNMGLGRINFKNDSTSYCMIRTLAQDVTAATSSGAMIFDIRTSNSTSRFLSLEGGITTSSDCQVVINDDGIDCNFRVESDSNTHMLFVDAGNNKVGIGVADPDSLLEVWGSGIQQKWSYDDSNFSTITVDSSSNTTIAVGQSGNLTLDVAGDIILDAAGNDISFKDNGTQFIKFTNNGGNCEIYNGAADTDIIFKDLGGNEIFRIDGSAESILVATNKKIEFSDSNEYISSDGTDLSIVSGGALTYTSAAASTWTIGGGDLTLDVTGDIILDAEGNDISFKDNGTQFIKFTNNGGNCEIYNGVADTDIIFKDLGGNEIFRIDGSAESILVATNKKIEFSDSNEYISSDGTDLSIVSGGALTYTSAAASTWTIGGGDLTLDVTGDIILDAAGNDISFKDNGTQFIKFTNNGGNCEIYNGAADTDIIFKDLGGNEIFRIDGSAESILVATNKKIEFSDSNEYISSDGTDLSIVSGGALTYTSAAASTWTIGGGDLTLDVTGDIILDAAGNDISFKDNGTQFIKFTNNGGNCEIYNGAADTDIIFKDSGGNEIFRIDGSAESILVATNKKIEFSDSNEYISSDGTDLSIVSGGALTYTSAAASTWTIGGGDLTLDVTGDIILDAAGNDISFKDNGTQFIKFTNNGGNCEIYNGAADTDIIFKDSGGNEIFRIDGSAESILVATNKKIEFSDSNEYISSDGTDLSIVSEGALTYTSAAASTWTIGGGDLTLDVTGDIILDTEGNDISFKDNGTQFIKFTNNGGNCEIYNGAADTDIIFKDLGGNEIFRIDGSAESILVATNKKIEFSDSNEYISSDGTDLSIVSGGALTYTSAAASTWTIGGGDLTLDVTGDIILDAAGNDISFKDNGTQFIKFTNNGGNCEIYNGVADTDIIFKDLGGNEIFRIDGSAESILVATNKKIEFSDSNEYISSDGTDLSIVSGGALTYTSAAASTWTIGGGDLTLDVTGDIILDAAGNDISFKDNGTQFIKFTNNGGNCEIYNGAADTDIIFKDLGGNEIFRIDGSAESILVATNKKIEFSDSNEYISSDGTDLSIVSGGALTYTSAAASTWTIGGGDLTLDVTGDIILDAEGNDISFKAAGTQELKFSNSSGSWTIQPKTSNKDLILRSNGTGDLITHLTDDNADSKFIIKDNTGNERFVVDSEGKSKLTSGSTTDNAFEIVASQTSANVLQITANSITNGKVIQINSSELTTGTAINIPDLDKLSSGKGIYLASNGTNDNMSGNLLDITFTGNNSNNTGNLMSIDNSGSNNNTISLNLNQDNINKPIIKLTNGNTASDHYSQTYLIKGQATAVNGILDFTIELDDDSTYFLNAYIVGRYKSGGTVESGVYTMESFIDKTSGTLTIDYTIDIKKETDTSGTTWNTELLDDSGDFKIRCQGQQNTIWLVKLELTKVEN
jgi:hypothetical protein